nr:hypothetical protein [uncultured Actinoplanes sp.]
MRRERALALTEGVLERLAAGQDVWPLRLVQEVYVYGSFARGALQPGDVDLDVEFNHQDEQWQTEFVQGLSYGYDARRVFRQALVGRKRGVQFTFDRHDSADFPMTLLWRRGEDLQTAMQRLHAIPVDPTAGRAERDAMLPEFLGMERWLPRLYRELLIGAVDAGAIRLERLTLADREVKDPTALAHLNGRWPSTSPLHRAGNAVFAHLLERGIEPAMVHLHGRDVENDVTPYFAGFGLRYFDAMQRCLTEHGGKEWIEVIHPTRRGDLLALKIIAVSRARLETLSWA